MIACENKLRHVHAMPCIWFSLTASKDRNESWIVVIIKTCGHIKASILDWKSSFPPRNYEIGEDHDINNICACLNGRLKIFIAPKPQVLTVIISYRHLVVGYRGNIAKLDAQTGTTLHSTALGVPACKA